MLKYQLMNNKEKGGCIVILGAGFGGLRTAGLLSKKIKSERIDCEIILIDRNSYHTYTPLLYEASATDKESANYIEIKKLVAFPIEELIRGTGIRFINSTVGKLDLINGDIHCENGEQLKFDYLVLAPGSETNYFDIPGLKENSLALKTFMDSLKIRDAILEKLAGKQIIDIVLGGGGSSGVELAGEIKSWLCDLEKYGQCKANLKIIEAAPAILPGFSEKVVEKAGKRLKSLGVEIISNEAISKADKNKVVLKSGREILYDVLVWTGGTKAPELLSAMPLKLEKRGRVEVAGEMQCLPQSPDLQLYGKIYGLGDAICFYDPKTGKPIPGVARAAISQANIVAHNILCDLKGNQEHKKYKPMDYPYIIPIGGKWAIAKIGPLVMGGLCGWILKGLVELNYLFSIMRFGKAIRIWLRGLRIFIQNDKKPFVR